MAATSILNSGETSLDWTLFHNTKWWVRRSEEDFNASEFFPSSPQRMWITPDRHFVPPFLLTWIPSFSTSILHGLGLPTDLPSLSLHAGTSTMSALLDYHALLTLLNAEGGGGAQRFPGPSWMYQPHHLVLLDGVEGGARVD